MNCTYVSFSLCKYHPQVYYQYLSDYIEKFNTISHKNHPNKKKVIGQNFLKFSKQPKIFKNVTFKMKILKGGVSNVWKVM